MGGAGFSGSSSVGRGAGTSGVGCKKRSRFGSGSWAISVPDVALAETFASATESISLAREGPPAIANAKANESPVKPKSFAALSKFISNTPAKI